MKPGMAIFPTGITKEDIYEKEILSIGGRHLVILGIINAALTYKARNSRKK